MKKKIKSESKRAVYKCQTCGKEFQSNEIVTTCTCGGKYKPMGG